MDDIIYDLPLALGTKELMIPSSIYDCIIEMRYFKENNFPFLKKMANTSPTQIQYS
jgi:hypothetical protein